MTKIKTTCKNCNSENVDIRSWVSQLDNSTSGETGEDQDTFCNSCETHSGVNVDIEYDDSKEGKIEELAKQILEKAVSKMQESVVKAIKCGALDIDDWDENCNSMILPKIIVKAVLEDEADQYSASGTAFEKVVKKGVKNLRSFL